MRYEVNLATGERIEHEDDIEAPSVPVPSRITARQFKLQLEIDGLTSSVEGWVAQQTRLVQIAYANSGTFVRSEPMMVAGFSALGFSDAEGDAFFTAAAAL
jgi:hypothetical protein